jgi:hypothetical protein
VNTALLLIQRMNSGLSVKEACNEVGMPRSTYYYVVAREAEAIAEFQNMVVANGHENLLMILVKQTELLEKVIEGGLAKTTKPKERLAINIALGAHKTLRQDLYYRLSLIHLLMQLIKTPFSLPYIY